jgi:hypothetical protein
MSLVSPAYLRYLTKFKRDVLNLEHFEYVCESIVKHIITSINDTFKRCAGRGETSTEFSIGLGNVINTQSIVERAPSDIKNKVEEQMFYYIIEQLKDSLKIYDKSFVKEKDGKSIVIGITWSDDVS